MAPAGTSNTATIDAPAALARRCSRLYLLPYPDYCQGWRHPDRPQVFQV